MAINHYIKGKIGILIVKLLLNRNVSFFLGQTEKENKSYTEGVLHNP